jgi:hypothetical protein
MDIHINEFTKILEKKLYFLNKVFALTNEVKLTGLADESEIFATLVDEREIVLINIQKLDLYMTSEKFNTIDKSNPNSTINKLQLEIHEVSKNIIELMEQHKKVFPAIMSNIKSNLKNLNASKNINATYYGSTLSNGSSFDTSK